MTDKMQRRDFLKVMGAGAGAMGIGAAGLSNKLPEPMNSPVSQIDPELMDEEHEKGVQIFLDGIGSNPDFWGREMAYEMDGDVKVFNMTVSEIEWDTGGGAVFPAMAYNGTIPGEVIRVTEGDKVRFNVTNEMAESHGVHWHGLFVPNNMDGVPFITQPPIKSGETFVYEFTVRNSGTHMYHSHLNSAQQTTKGLLGAFIVDPANKSDDPEVAGDFIFVLNDTSLGFTINGKGFPYTQPIVANKGDTIRIRYFNEGLMIHPMHLHGMPMQVIAKDGWVLPQPYHCDTLNIAPGERYDVLVECTEPGAWAFHCHILTHAEGPMGMFGMVTALVVNE